MSRKANPFSVGSLLLGLTLVVAGVGQWSIPAAFITTGALLVFAAYKGSN